MSDKELVIGRMKEEIDELKQTVQKQKMLLANSAMTRRDTDEDQIVSFRQKTAADLQQTTAETKMNQHTGSNEDASPEKLHMTFSQKQQQLLEEIEEIKEGLLS